MPGLGLLATLLIGGIAGWLAGKIMRGGGFGILGNIAVGIVGSFAGRFVFGLLGLSAGGWIGSLVMSTIGAVILLWLVGILKK